MHPDQNRLRRGFEREDLFIVGADLTLTDSLAYADDVFPRTPSGKAELASPALEARYGARLPSFRPVESPYPLALISPTSDRRPGVEGFVPRP